MSEATELMKMKLQTLTCSSFSVTNIGLDRSKEQRLISLLTEYFLNGVDFLRVTCLGSCAMGFYEGDCRWINARSLVCC